MTRASLVPALAFLVGTLLLACGQEGTAEPPRIDGGVQRDAAAPDAALPWDPDGGVPPIVLEDAGTLDAGAPDAEAPADDLGVGDGLDVITVGDSWMNLIIAGIQQSLTRVSGRPYRTYGVPGTRLLDGVIPGQYYGARDEDADIKTVVVTGGGNDILLDPAVIADCLRLGPRCRDVIDRVGERYRELAVELAADGVEDLVIINYSRGTPLGPAAIDYSWATLGPICDDAPVDCHMVDPDVIAGGRMPLRDGIHPTNAGYDLIGEYLVELMEREGMRR